MPIYSHKTLTTLKQHKIVEFKNVFAGYSKINVLEDISFSLNSGDFLYIIGPNGAGKSTLIRLIIKVINNKSGEISISTQKIGFLPQNLTDKRHFPITVREVIYTGFRKQNLKIDKEQTELIKKWLDLMEISHLENKMMSELSGGEQQRVFLIRAIISNPELLILDEPTSALDPSFKGKFSQIIYDLNKSGVTIIFVTHDLHEIFFHDCKIMRVDKKIKFFGTKDEYKKLYEKQL